MWISYLIRKLWDSAWYIRKYRDHTLHATDGPTKKNSFINTIVTYHYNRGMQ